MKNFIYILFIIPCIVFSQSRIDYLISTNTDPSINITPATYNFESNDLVENKIIEKKIWMLLENQLNNNGWVKNSSDFKYKISISFSISDGNTTSGVKNVPITNYYTGKTTYYSRSFSNTTFERKISVFINLDNSLVWQGDIISHGSTKDVFFIAEHLVPQIVPFIVQKDFSKEYTHSCTLSCPDLSDKYIKKLKKKNKIKKGELAEQKKKDAQAKIDLKKALAKEKEAEIIKKDCGLKPKLANNAKFSQRQKFDKALKEWNNCRKKYR